MRIFLHNIYDKKSHEMLKNIDSDIQVIDYFNEQEKIRELNIQVAELPCVVEIPKDDGSLEKLKMLHLIADLSGCRNNFTKAGPAKKFALFIIAKAGMTPIGEATATVEDDEYSGATVIIVVVPLKESHISLHTWPELGFAAVDLFTCGDHEKAKAAFKQMCDWFVPDNIVIQSVKRGPSK